ncbi:MAG: phosphonate ABC transporter, permease protein PhnE [Actinomycetota bacterium]|nr:phosphonate ABC transporter, permease protein PhnE [Actinomycetota bacterium]
MTAPAGARPAKPRPGWGLVAGLVGFAALTWWAGGARYGIGFSVAEMIDNARRARRIVSDFFNPDWNFAPATVAPFVETLQMAILAAVIGCAAALIVAFLASRLTTPNNPVYLVDKGGLNVLRALPDLLYALVFVAAFSIGPLGGILALIMFNVGVVAKLLSETVDGVDTGPVEAAQAAGAGRLQTVRTAVFPQVLPNYLAYSLYAFELNLRASTVIGYVGAGGIGQLVQTQVARFAYGRVTVIIVEIFVIVFVIESISIALRRRLV